MTGLSAPSAHPGRSIARSHNRRLLLCTPLFMYLLRQVVTYLPRVLASDQAQFVDEGSSLESAFMSARCPLERYAADFAT